VPGHSRLIPSVSSIRAGAASHATSHQRLGRRKSPREVRRGWGESQRAKASAVSPGINMIPFATTNVSSECHDPPRSRYTVVTAWVTPNSTP